MGLFAPLRRLSMQFRVDSKEGLKSPEQGSPKSPLRSPTTAAVYQLLDGRRLVAYPNRLVQMICDYHDSTGGKRYSAADIGCGVGTGALMFAPHFDHVAGVEPTASILKSAARGKTRIGEQINYQQADVHHMPYLLHNSVDLIISAGVAHEFAFKWWHEADRVLTYDGTVALFTFGPPMVAERLTGDDPVVSAIKQMEDFWDETISSHITKQEAVLSSLYTTMPFPEAQFAFGKPKHLWWNSNSGDKLSSSAHNYAETPEDTELSRITAFTFDQWLQQRKSSNSYAKMRKASPKSCTDLDTSLFSMAKAVGWIGEKKADFTSSLGLMLIKKRKRYETVLNEVSNVPSMKERRNSKLPKEPDYQAGSMEWIGGIGTKRMSMVARPELSKSGSFKSAIPLG